MKTPEEIPFTKEELWHENQELRKIGQQAMDEREVMIKAFDAIRKEFKGRHWLTEGRGTYPYNDDRYKEEVRYIMDAFNEINHNVWKQIKSKTFEYKDTITKPLFEKIRGLEEIDILAKEHNLVCWMVPTSFDRNNVVWGYEIEALPFSTIGKKLSSEKGSNIVCSRQDWPTYDEAKENAIKKCREIIETLNQTKNI